LKKISNFHSVIYFSFLFNFVNFYWVDIAHTYQASTVARQVSMESKRNSAKASTAVWRIWVRRKANQIE